MQWIWLAKTILFYYLCYYIFGYKALFYKKTLLALRNHNIIFTKFFQALANKGLELSPELHGELVKYTTNTDYSTREIDYDCLERIEKEYGLEIDRRVINSGMIALVFKATDASGNARIVKLKRKGVTAQLKYGCDYIARVHKFLYRWYPQNLILRLVRPLIFNIHDIMDQCNFDREIQNLQQAKRDYAPLSFIHIPTVYNNSALNTDFIIMEYVDGTHYLAPETSDDVRKDLLDKFYTYTTFSYFNNTIQHTDLHEGNYLFTKDGLGLLDYGMAFNPSEDMHDVILSIIYISHEGKKFSDINCTDTFKNLFCPPIDSSTLENPEKVEAIIQDIIETICNIVEMNEAKIFDNVELLSAEIKQEIVLNSDAYKLFLSVFMKGADAKISGNHFTNEQLLELRTNALASVIDMN